MLRKAAVAFCLCSGLASSQALEQAKKAFDRADYKTALELFEASKSRSSSCETIFYIGLTRYRLGLHNEAIIDFQSAVQCEPKMLLAHLALGDIYAQRGNNTESLRAYEQVLKLDPKNGPALKAAAAIYLRAEADDQALTVLETLIAVDPNDPGVHADLAAVYAAKGKRAEAEQQFKEALRLNAGFSPALMGLANLYLRTGSEEQVLPLLERAVAAQPESFQAHFLLGSAHNRSGEFEKARVELEKAVELGGSAPELYYHLARAFGGLGQSDERRAALKKFSELILNAKNSKQALRDSERFIKEAREFLQAGNLEAAIERLEQAREVTPGDATILFRLAGLHYDLQKLNPAREYVEAAISITPSVWLYHYLLGLIEIGSNQWTAARASLDTAARLNPNAAEVQAAIQNLEAARR